MIGQQRSQIHTDTSAMLKLARIYLLTLFTIQVLLFAAILVLHISLLHINLGMRTWRFTAESAQGLLVGTLLWNFPILLLAKERNVWKNELKSCPMWLQWLVRLLFINVLFSILLQVVLSSQVGGPEDLVAISAVMLSFNAIGLCILYAVLWSNSVGEAEVIRRSRNSFIAAVIVVAVVAASHSGYLLHPVRAKMQ